MAIDKAKVDAITAEISAAIASAATVAESVDPALAPYAIIGRAVAGFSPGLVDDVVNLLNKSEPTADEINAFVAKCQALASPETI